MSDLLPLEEALARMVGTVNPLAPRPLPLLEADGCILAADCIAQVTKPPFAVSAMDGYALPAAPVAGAQYHLVGEVPAGGHHPGNLMDGQAVRIFTGAPVPVGASHVLIQEDAVREGDSITVGDRAGSGDNIRPKGGDFGKGDVLIPKGAKLAPQHIGLAASGNHATLLCQPKPTVAIMMNGDELTWPGSAPNDSAIIASNGYALATLAQRFGAKLADLTLIPDNQSEIEAYIAASEADILLTIGGASVGDYDLIRPALLAQNYVLDFPKVALRPGKPTLFGHKGKRTVLGLPGNPVSSFVSAMIFLRPLIEHLAGRSSLPLLALQTAQTAVDLPSNGPRAHFMRATCSENGELTPVTSQDSSLLRLLSGADALMYRPPHASALNAGAQIEFLPLPT